MTTGEQGYFRAKITISVTVPKLCWSMKPTFFPASLIRGVKLLQKSWLLDV